MKYLALFIGWVAIYALALSLIYAWVCWLDDASIKVIIGFVVVIAAIITAVVQGDK